MLKNTFKVLAITLPSQAAGPGNCSRQGDHQLDWLTGGDKAPVTLG